MSDDKDSRKGIAFGKTLAIAVEFGFAIVIPLLVFGYLGKWLETKYNTKLLLIACIAFAIVASSVWLYLRIMDIFEDLKNL
jgi:hypothetical protein